MTIIKSQAITDFSNMFYSVLPFRTISSREELDIVLEPDMQAYLQGLVASRDTGKTVATQAEKAIQAWRFIEQRFLENNRIERRTFLEAVASLQYSKVLPDSLKPVLPNCHGVIFNIEWINAFAWQLPILFPKEIECFHEIGKMMAGIFYLERYDKAGRTISDALKAERINALMKLVGFVDNSSNK